MKKILFVDDEAQILKAIKRIFMDSDYKIYCAESAEVALKIMCEDAIDMVITDMRMPGMDGIELLKITKRKYPKTVRIILSGFADENEIMYSLQNNIAKTYMFKPWDNDELIRIVEQNLENNEISLSKELISYINSMDQLPTITSRYQSILNAVEQDKSYAEIAVEIERDQTVTAKVLQVVNSAYFGIRTGSVKKALSIIGLNDLENLIHSIEIMECLSISGVGCRTAEGIWNHTYYTNKIQHIIQENFLHKKASHYDATAGLLHKIGIVLMIKYNPKDYISFLNKALENNGPYLNHLEEEKYGFTHSAVSGYLLKWWNAPDQMVEAATFYNSPLNDSIVNKELVKIVHIAQHYACVLNNFGYLCEFEPETFEDLGIDRMNFEENYKKFL